MSMHDHLFTAQTAPPQASAFPLADSIASLGTRIADWLATAADYYAAAASTSSCPGSRTPSCSGAGSRAQTWRATSAKPATAPPDDTTAHERWRSQ
jgi:hypothetical protein